MLKACEGQDFVDRRDTAIVRTFIDTGARLAEMAGLRLEDVDLDDQTLTVMGKGSRVRVLPIGAKAVKAIDRYLRVRRGHREHGLPALWLGRSGGMGTSGIPQMFRRRATEAGLDHLNPHQFRHTFAHQWLRSEGPRATSWRSPGGARGRCSYAMARARGPSGRGRRTSG